MVNIAIQKIHGNPAEADAISEEAGALAEQVRALAFSLFQRRGGCDGHAIEDWLDAERELVLTPFSDLVAKDGQYRIRVAAPGFDAQDIRVTAYPTAVVVTGEFAHSHAQGDGEVRFCDFAHKTLFRRLELPDPIDVNTVRAKLANGILQVTANRAEEQDVP